MGPGRLPDSALKRSFLAPPPSPAPVAARHMPSRVPPPALHAVPRVRDVLQMKALNKKIRQVEELEAKVASGEVVPSDEQRQKLARKPALVAELAEVREKFGSC